MRQLETSLVPVWMEEGGYGWGMCRAQLPGLQSWREKKSVEPKPEEKLLSQCREALPHPACSDLLLPLLGSNAQSTHHPACCGGVIIVRSHVVLWV